MQSRNGSLMRAAAISLLSFTANCAVFIFSYNRLATPYLAEEQRVANAGFILTITGSAYALVAIAIGLVVYRILRRAPER